MENLIYDARPINTNYNTLFGDNTVEREDVQTLVRNMNRMAAYARLTPFEFGAIADNQSHKIREWLVGGSFDRGYTTLADIQIDYPFVNDLDFDEIDYAAIQKAADVSLNYGWGVRRPPVFFPNGTYIINRTVYTGHEVPFVGESRASSVIKTSPDWDRAASYYMIEAARGGIDYQHNNGLYFIGLDGGLRTNGGIWWWNVNEHGGAYFSEVKNFKEVGLRFKKRDGQSDPVINFTIYDMHIATTQGEEDCIGIDIKDVNHPLLIQKGTCLLRGPSGGPGPNGIGIQVESGDMFMGRITDYHFENCRDGILMKSGHLTVENCEGWSTVNNTIRIADSMNNNDDKCLIKGVIGNRNLGSGACIQDDNLLVDGAPMRYGRPFFTGSYVNAGYNKNGYGLSNEGRLGKVVEPAGATHAGKFLIAHGFRTVDGLYVLPEYANVDTIENRDVRAHIDGYTADRQHAIVSVEDRAGVLQGGTRKLTYRFSL